MNKYYKTYYFFIEIYCNSNITIEAGQVMIVDRSFRGTALVTCFYYAILMGESTFICNENGWIGTAKCRKLDAATLLCAIVR